MLWKMDGDWQRDKGRGMNKERDGGCDKLPNHFSIFL